MLARLILAAVVLVSGVVAWAQAPAPVPAPARAGVGMDRLTAVAPYVNERTVFVGYVDLRKVKMEALEALVLEQAQVLTPEEDRPAMLARVRMAMAFARQWHKALVEIGAAEVYGVADTQTVKREPGFLVIPNIANAEESARKLQKALGQGVVVTAAEGVVLVSSQRTAGELAGYEPADRPDLMAAFATSDAPVVLAGLLPDDFREEALRNMPPKMPQHLGGAATAPLVQGFQWGLAELRLQPSEQVRATIQMKDEVTAKEVEKIVRSQWVNEGMEAPFPDLMTPKAQGSRLTLALDKQQVASLAPAVQQGRTRARQVQSMSQMRQLLMGVQLYAQDHKRAYPEKLEDLGRYLGGMLPRMLTNPLDPQRRPGYVYLKPAGTVDAVKPETALIYEAWEKWPACGIAVGFADGHVERLTNEGQVREMIKAAGGGKQ